jgi:ABC-type nitrate/sulfonate/bicarbonate transport system substrate-binding protein
MKGENMKRRLTIILLLTYLVIASGVFAQGDSVQNLERVRLIALAPSALQWLNAIAEDQEFYAQNGVVVETIQAQNSAALVQAVASGSADAGVALGDNAMRAVDEGAPIVISGAILYKPILRLIGAVDSVEELRGQRVTGGAVTGGTSDLLLYQLLQHGVQPDEVQVVGIPNSRDRLVGFQNGQLEGGLLIAPFDILAIREGFNVLDVYGEPWLQTPLVLNRDWASRNPNAARGITQAFADAARWIYDPANRDEAVRILAEYTDIETDVVEEAYEFIVVEQEAISPDLSVPEESLSNILVIRQAVHGGELEPFNLSDYYDPSFLED